MEQIRNEKYEKMKNEGVNVELKNVKVAKNEVNLEGIYSYQTFEDYKKASLQFVKWIEATHNEIKFVRDSHDLAAEYLQSLVDRNLAATTVSTHGSALAKLFDRPADSFGFKFPDKKQEDITKGRKEQPWDASIKAKYAEELNVLGVIGLRRHEAAGVKISQISADYSMIYNVDGKGGKIRNVEVLEPQILKNYVEKHPQKNDKIFPKLPKRMNIQQERRNYATKFYEREENKLYPDKSKIDIRAKDADGKLVNYITREGEKSQAFNKEILTMITQNLGHNRLDVVVRNYLR
jgi:integrase